MIIRTRSYTIMLLASTPAAPGRVLPVLKIDNAVLLDDIVVTGSRMTAPEPELAIPERVSSPPASLAELTGGFVSGTIAKDKSADRKEVDADLHRATRALRYDR